MDDAPAASRIVPVWDAAIRLFHWGVVTLLMISVLSVNRGMDRLHVMSGYATAALLLFRAGWGVFGSDSAPLFAVRAQPAGRMAASRPHGCA